MTTDFGGQDTVRTPLGAVLARRALARQSGPAEAPPEITPEAMVDAWITYLSAATTSTKTLGVRRTQVNRVAKRFDLRTVTEDQLLSLLSSPDLARATKKGYRSAWRSFFGFCMARGYRNDNPAAGLPTVRVPRGLPKPTPEASINAALASEDEPTRLMVLLAAYAGLRRSEIARAELAWITPEGLRITGKGDKVRTVPIHPRLRAPLEEFAARQPGPWLFPSRYGGFTNHVSEDHVSKRLKAATGEVGHHLRHRFGTKVYQGRHDLRATQELMGHASPTTTAIYTLVEDDAKTAAVLSIA